MTTTKLYSSPTLPSDWIAEHQGQLWLVGTYPGAWHQRRPYLGHRQGLIEAPEHTARLAAQLAGIPTPQDPATTQYQPFLAYPIPGGNTPMSAIGLQVTIAGYNTYADHFTDAAAEAGPGFLQSIQALQLWPPANPDELDELPEDIQAIHQALADATAGWPWPWPPDQELNPDEDYHSATLVGIKGSLYDLTLLTNYLARHLTATVHTVHGDDDRYNYFPGKVDGYFQLLEALQGASGTTDLPEDASNLLRAIRDAYPTADFLELFGHYPGAEQIIGDEDYDEDDQHDEDDDNEGDPTYLHPQPGDEDYEPDLCDICDEPIESPEDLAPNTGSHTWCNNQQQ